MVKQASQERQFMQQQEQQMLLRQQHEENEVWEFPEVLIFLLLSRSLSMEGQRWEERKSRHTQRDRKMWVCVQLSEREDERNGEKYRGT